MSDAQPSDAMKNLVVFLVCLAIMGAILAFALYFAVELPLQLQQAGHAPANYEMGLRWDLLSQVPGFRH